jgi:hypothetical protein
MPSLYLSRLSEREKQELKRKLYEIQNGKCFICEEHIDLILHKDMIDIDHIIPIKMNGPDNPSNFALTHSSCNRSKQDSDLNVAKILVKFENIKQSIIEQGRGVNLGDILRLYNGAKYSLKLKIEENNIIKFSFPEKNNNKVFEANLFHDKLSNFSYFFAVIPIEYLHHDDKINPRPIGSNISKLIKEFYLKRPQLHVSLGWVDTNENEVKIKIFDGQHKAAAQILLGTRELPVRIFINPDIDVLLTTNTNAGTLLRQVAFDKSVQRHLGSALYIDRVEKYMKDHKLSEDDFNFSEKDLVKYFRGESREMKRYILDSVRDSITHNPDNKLKDYIDFGGRGKEKPLSYSTIEKTFYSFFIYQEVLETPINYLLEEGENPRDLEKQQLVELMNIIAEEIYIGKYDADIGTSQIENKIQKGEDIPSLHLIAFRMSKEEIIYNWLKYIEQIIKSYFIMQGKPINEQRLFQYKFPEPLWDKIRIFIKNLSQLPIWINNELSKTVFGGKQNNDYWQTIFETGKSPQGIQVLSEPINLMKMIIDNNAT